MFRMFVAALFILVTFISGSSQQVSSVVTRVVQESGSSNDARVLSKDAYELILKNDYDAAIRCFISSGCIKISRAGEYLRTESTVLLLRRRVSHLHTSYLKEDLPESKPNRFD